MSSNTLLSDSFITDVSIVSSARATTDQQEEEQGTLLDTSISLKREVKDDGSMTSDSSIPCAPSSNCSPYISPANSPEKKRSTALPASSSPACYEMTPTTRNTSGQYGRPMTNFLPTVVSPDEGGPPRVIGYFMEDGGVLSGQTSYFDHPDSSATNSLREVNRRLQMPDKDSDNSTSAQKYLLGSASMARSRSLCCVPNTTPGKQQQPDASLLTDMSTSTSQQQYWHDEQQDEDNDSYMRDDDDYDTLAEDPSMNNYQDDDDDEESQDHIGNIHFPPRKNNLSFHSLDEGEFRRAISSRNNPPLIIGRSPPSTSYLLEAYRPVRNDSLTEFGLRDSAVEAAAIFKDDDASSLYRPIPLTKGNSTGTHFSIPSIRLGAPLAFGDDNSSIRSAGDIGSEGWWNESIETMSDIGSVRGSFDEADGMSVTGKCTVTASRDRKQSVFEWLEDVKNQGSVEEAASSKFLREPTPLMAYGSAPHRASTRFTPVVAVGGKPPRLDIRRSLFAPNVPRRSVSGSERARTFQAKENHKLHISF